MATVVPIASLQPPAPAASAAGLGSFSLGAAALAVGANAALALLRPARAIGPIVASVTVEEVARDDLEITEHPVEKTAPITDHAFKRPADVVIRCGWSNALRLPGYTTAVYSALLNLQYSRIPFTLVTGKRTYVNMLIASIAQTTDAATENALMVSLTCKQVVIAQATLTNVPPTSQQSQPASTGGTQQAGQQQPTPQPNVSLLSRGLSWFSGVFGPGSPPAGASAVGPAHA